MPHGMNYLTSPIRGLAEVFHQRCKLLTGKAKKVLLRQLDEI